MAKKVCELCANEYSTEMRFGVHLCKNCVQNYSKALHNDTNAVSFLSESTNFPNATETAKSKIIAFFKKKATTFDESTTDGNYHEEAVNSSARTDSKVLIKSRSNLNEDSNDILFGNIGGKIKSLAKLVFVIGLISSLIVAIILISLQSEVFVTLGIIILFVGPLLSWVSVLILYAFGELVETNSSNKLILERIEQILSSKD